MLVEIFLGRLRLAGARCRLSHFLWAIPRIYRGRGLARVRLVERSVDRASFVEFLQSGLGFTEVHKIRPARCDRRQEVAELLPARAQQSVIRLRGAAMLDHLKK